MTIFAFTVAPLDLKKYEKVMKETSRTNCTVFCGNLIKDTAEATEDSMRKLFNPFGEITGIISFENKHFAFIRQESKPICCDRNLKNLVLFSILVSSRKSQLRRPLYPLTILDSMDKMFLVHGHMSRFRELIYCTNITGDSEMSSLVYANRIRKEIAYFFNE